MNPERPDRRLAWSVGPLMTQGLQLALTVVILFFLGEWLDGRWGTSPWLMLAGIVLGTVGGLIKFIRTAMQVGREEDAREKSTQPRE